MNVHSFWLYRMQDKRDLILRATEQLIAAEGLHNLSMHKLAKEAKVAAGTIYRYFTDKEDLISQLRQDALINVAEFIFSDLTQTGCEEQFTHIWFNLLKLGSSQSHNILTYQQYNQLPGTDTKAHRAFERQTFKPLLNMFEQGRQQGVIAKLDDEYLFSIGFEPAVALGRRIKDKHLQYSESELAMACKRCWLAISAKISTH